MSRRTEFLDSRRRSAWEHGRRVYKALCAEYESLYKMPAPAPALISGELLTDFLGVRLVYDPLPLHVFAETEWKDERLVVTVNSLTCEMPGVKDAAGVENVAKLHEGMHVVDDASDLREDIQPCLPGLDIPRRIVCHRAPPTSHDPNAREFLAEEAGRAAAVSLPHLRQSESFQELCDLGQRMRGPIPQGFPLLYKAAEDIGVNISALVTQLSLEGLIGVQRDTTPKSIVVQPTLMELMVA